jgi:hypothetical protein
MSKRDCLVIARAGAASQHRLWGPAPGETPRFDLLICAYDAAAMDEDVDGLRHCLIPGTKVAGYAEAFETLHDTIFAYRCIALLDDDIVTDHAAIARCFEIGKAEAFAIWQPSLDWDSYFTYAGFLSIPGLAWRKVNFVEMMCPFFTAEALAAVRPLFRHGWESGIDLAWCPMVRPAPCAVIDEVSVHHSRAVGKLKSANGFVDREYTDDIAAVLSHYGLKWPSLVALSAKTTRGRTIGRGGVILHALRLLLGKLRTPQRPYITLVLDHIRHLCTRELMSKQRRPVRPAGPPAAPGSAAMPTAP